VKLGALANSEGFHQRERRTGRRQPQTSRPPVRAVRHCCGDIWLIEKLAHFDRDVIPERRMPAKGWSAHGTFTVTHDITHVTEFGHFRIVPHSPRAPP